MLLNKTIIDRLEPSEKVKPNRPDKHSDGNGLQLLVRHTGTKTWLSSYNWNGKNQNITIGRYPAMSLRQARERNNEIRKMLYNGINPKEKILEKKRQLSGDYLFKAYAKKYHDLQSNKIKSNTYDAMISLYSRQIAPMLDNKPVVSITPLDVLKMAQKTVKSSGNEQARRAVRQVKQIMKLAIIEGLIQVNPANEITMLLPDTTTEHRARVEVGDLHQLLNDINDYNGHEQIKIALMLLAHTFTRVSELLSAEWTEIDFDRELWTIPAHKMKMNREHLVPLSPTVIDLLKQLKALTADNHHIFNNPTTGKPYTRTAVTNALYNMGYKGVMTAHGFRGIASTTLHDMDYKPHLIEIQLSHVTFNKVSRAYNNAKQLLARRGMMTKWSKFLNDTMNNKPNDEILFDDYGNTQLNVM